MIKKKYYNGSNFFTPVLVIWSQREGRLRKSIWTVTTTSSVKREKFGWVITKIILFLTNKKDKIK